jgi:N-acetylglucosamine-6-phosphate deacetylase
MRTVITAAMLFDGSTFIDHPMVTIEDGHIQAISQRENADLPNGSGVLDFPGSILAPAFFDVHFHGAAGHDVMEATPAALEKIGSFLASHGTGSFLATTVTAGMDATLKAVSGLAKLIERRSAEGQARPIGIHLEGPFLSHAKRGVQPAEHLLAPDLATFDKLFEAGEGHVRLMTLAPELPGAAELAAHATSRGVRISIGHSNATAVETRSAIAAGAVSATHTFNAMRPLDHREPGILGTVLTTETLFAEFICDGIHSAREMAKLWWNAKGESRGILITDAMSAAGMPDGAYQLGGFDVQVENCRATANGVLAGSVLTLDRALANFVEFTGATVEQGLHLLTANPARMTGMTEQTGTVELGMPANVVAIDTFGRLCWSVVGGRPVAVS